jgi:biopolymer transport protein ExbD
MLKAAVPWERFLTNNFSKNLIMKREKKKAPKVEFPISAMIDCTFLLLIYFMVACSLHKQEADISFSLPGMAEASEPLTMPDEQILEIHSDGSVILNDLPLDSPESKELPNLIKTLTRFRETCAAAKTEAMLTINADDNVHHQRVVEVLNACSAAKLENVTFAFEDENKLF